MRQGSTLPLKFCVERSSCAGNDILQIRRFDEGIGITPFGLVTT